MRTTHVGVHEAKARLSEYLNRAAYRGERIIVERHGKPVAALVGLDDLRRLEDSAPTGDQQLKPDERYAAFRHAMESAGVITWPSAAAVKPGEYAPIELEGPPLSDQIIEDRR